MRLSPRSKFLILSLTYFLAMMFFCFYWRDTHKKYEHLKGDNIVYCLQMILAISYIYLIGLYLVMRGVKLYMLPFIPLLVVVVDFFLVILIAEMVLPNKTDESGIKLYGMIYNNTVANVSVTIVAKADQYHPVI